MWFLGTDSSSLPFSAVTQGPIYFSSSPTGQCSLYASPFPPLPIGFLLSLSCMWISSYISVMPRRELFFMQTYPNFVVPSVCFLGRAPLFHPTLPKPQFSKTPMNIPLEVSEQAKQENLLFLYNL